MAPFIKSLLEKSKAKQKVTKEKEQARTDSSGTPPPPPMPGEDIGMVTREVVKPDNQLQLTEQEMQEEIAKMLTANNPQAPKNVVRFNMKERNYKLEPMVEQTIVHYATDGWLIHKSSEEAKKQAEADKEAEASGRRTVTEAGTGTDAGTGAGTAAGEAEGFDEAKHLRNQFNFSERAAQTLNYPLRERGTMTEPPPTATISGSCSMREIFDEYVKDFERQKLEESSKQKAGAKKAAAGGSAAPSSCALITAGSGRHSDNVLELPSMCQALQIMDRMINQNTFEAVAMDFKYWEDPTDGFRPHEGTLLPLWTFKYEKARSKQVTSICWSPTYDDMFAVGYGSFEFMAQTTGLVAIFSLKNPSHPEFSFVTDAGVQCLHFHPDFPNLLAVGCYDGNVLVFDVRSGSSEPMYSSGAASKHVEPVTQVYWQIDELQKSLQFVSVSLDGHVLLWTLAKAELQRELLMRLQLQAGQHGQQAGQQHGEGGAAEVAPGGTASGTCIDFSKAPGQDHMYLVGTEEGLVHSCSKAYGSDYLATWPAHSLAVYSVRWNPLHHSVFLSASVDWSVKLWDSRAAPAAGSGAAHSVMTFDLNEAVGDAAWAPFSATVFSAVTDDGKVHVFDVAENKLQPLCSQKVSKHKLTRVAFNPRHPVLLVGDARGQLTSLKLSPNLRKALAGEVAGDAKAHSEAECRKLEAVLEVARRARAAAGEK